jgi:hypothetical protein
MVPVQVTWHFEIMAVGSKGCKRKYPHFKQYVSSVVVCHAGCIQVSCLPTHSLGYRTLRSYSDHTRCDANLVSKATNDTLQVPEVGESCYVQMFLVRQENNE